MSPSPENTFDAGPYSRVPHALRWAGRGPHWLRNRAFALAAVAWVPLAVFSAAQGLALSDQRRESQLLDISAYVRYLVAIPTFVLAEAICLPQLGKIVRQFLDAGLVTGDERAGYETILDSTRTLLTSPEVELALLAIAYISTLATSESLYPEAVSTWVSPIREGSRTLSLAGWWLMLVSQPLYQVLIAIWLWRVVVWARLLWKLSRLNLQLLPSHPDRAGGLAFVGTSLRGFTPVAFGLGAAVAAGAAEAIFVDGRPVQEFKLVVGALVVGMVVLFAGPLFIFAPPLRRARIRGIFAYGELASAVGRRFEERWLGRHGEVSDDALSVQDFSATTDLYQVVANVSAMRVTPVNLWILIPLVVATLLPFVPIVLAILPLRELLALIAKLAM